MLVKTARFLAISCILGLIGLSNVLILVDSIAVLHSKVVRFGLNPFLLFVVSWVAVLLIRLKWFRQISAFWMYSFLFIVVPISTVTAGVLTYLEVSHFYNYVFSQYGIYFQSVVVWCFSSWLFGLVLITEKLFKKYWRRIVFIIPVLFLVGMGMVWLWPQDVFLKLVQEDSWIENLQVLVLVVGSVASFLLAKNLFHQKKVLIALLFFLVSVGLVFIAGGILMNRLKAVIDGDAELWFRWFDTGLKKEHYVETPEQARELIKLVAQGNYSGGGTAIANCVREAVKQIQELEAEGFRYRPELVVVTDGEDDTSSLKLSELAGIKLHAFVVECKNRNFAELARRTGGVGVENF
jgi:hypothetical protein